MRGTVSCAPFLLLGSQGDLFSGALVDSRRGRQGAWVLGSASRIFLSGFSAQLAHPYRTMILRAMETVVSGHISELDKDVARAVILLASSEMTRAKVGGGKFLY